MKSVACWFPLRLATLAAFLLVSGGPSMGSAREPDPRPPAVGVVELPEAPVASLLRGARVPAGPDRDRAARQARRKARSIDSRREERVLRRKLRRLGRGSKSRGASKCGGPTLCAAEVDAIVARAASALDSAAMTVAVVDRLGNPLALFRKPAADPGNDDFALGLARTAAFFSNDRAPLSSRTVRFLTGKNFPPGIDNTPSGALYGVENTNRGCDLNLGYNPGRRVPPARSVEGTASDLRCDAFDRSGCGPGVVTGKFSGPSPGIAELLDNGSVNPGGIPIFRPRGDADAILLGGVGVAGVPRRHAEFAAFEAGFGDGTTSPVPEFPLPAPGNVFIDGVRLPFVKQPNRPAGTTAGDLVGAYDSRFRPSRGKRPPAGYLVGPIAGARLTSDEVDRIVQRTVAVASRTRAQIRLPVGFCTRMIIAVGDLDGTILALFRMSDAVIFSLDVSVAKARNVVYFSGPGAADLPGVPPGTAVTNRTIGFGAQPFFPSGITSSAPGPFFDLYVGDSLNACSQGSQVPNENQNGVVFFPGAIPLYRGDALVGGLGVSGDGVEQDDYVAFLGAEGYQPPPAIQANRFFIDGVRLPFLKFPRNPEACER